MPLDSRLPAPLLAVLLASAWAPSRQIGTLAAPTGPGAVGTAVFHLVDSSRRDASFPGGRPITLQLWYPAVPVGAAAVRAPYLVERGLARVLLQGPYYGVDSTALQSWASLRTNSATGAAPAGSSHPLVTFSVGLGVIRANYTMLAEELASRGYVVALVENPLAGLMELPDGRMLADTAGVLEDPAAHRSAVGAWARDISFVLDRLQRRELAPAVGRTVDWARVGAIGHSTGGLVAFEACRLDPRIRAAVDLDGGFATPDRQPLADFVPLGITWPALILRSRPLYSDADFARRGITRAEWEQRGAGGKAALDSLVTRSKGPLYLGDVGGTGHMSFSDAPFVMPTTISRFGGKIIDPARSREVVSAVLRAFFDRYLGAGDRRALDGLTGRFPEVALRLAAPSGPAPR